MGFEAQMFNSTDTFTFRKLHLWGREDVKYFQSQNGKFRGCRDEEASFILNISEVSQGGRGDGGHWGCDSALGQVTVSQLEMLSVTRAG